MSAPDDELKRMNDPATLLRTAIDYALSEAFEGAPAALIWLREWRKADKLRDARETQRKTGTPPGVWPDGCIKRRSCARNRACMYGCEKHWNRPNFEVRPEIDAAIARAESE